MEIAKNLNFSKLRNTVTGYFTGIRGFWISAGAGFLILTILFFVFIYPLLNQYAKIYKDLCDLTNPLENYALKVKHVYNDKWITSKKLEADMYGKEIEKCKSFLREKDKGLEAVFVMDDPVKGLVSIEDEALWKNEYVKRVSELLTKLEETNIAVDEGALPFHDWGAAIPARDAIAPVQKKFRVLEAFINVVLKDTGVTRLEKITFRESSFTYDPSAAKLYTVIPVTIRIELQADHIKSLLCEILRSDIPCVVEGVNILSAGKYYDLRSSMADEDSLPENIGNRSPNPVIDVTLDVYVIDYQT